MTENEFTVIGVCVITFLFGFTCGIFSWIAKRPSKRVIWVNLYPETKAMWHSTLKVADESASFGRIGGKAWKLEIEE